MTNNLIKNILLKLAEWVAKRYDYSFKKIDRSSRYKVTAFNSVGEQISTLKIHPNKRKSKSNMILGWNIYENGKLVESIRS